MTLLRADPSGLPTLGTPKEPPCYDVQPDESGCPAERSSITTIADVLADCGDLPLRLVDQHGNDGTGHCVVCAEGGQSGRKAFPCPIRSAATAALIVQARRHNPP